MKNTPRPHPKPRRLSFSSKLERISPGAEYYALSVPKKISADLETRGPVPVSACVNESEVFIASLFPVGGGRHYLRVKNKTCKEVGIKEGSRVRVQVTVRDRAAEVSIPKDLLSALRAEGRVEQFKALPIGKRSYLIRCINEAARPETRVKRIQAAVKALLGRR